MTELLERNETRAPELPDTPEPPAKPRLLDQMRAAMRTRHYSLRTEKTYTYWVRYFIHWHDLRHTWATWHVMAGTPVEVLQKLGGWSDIRMVLRYAHFAPEYLATWADNAKPWSQRQDAA